MAKKEDVAKLGPYVELKVFLRYLWISYSKSVLKLIFCEWPILLVSFKREMKVGLDKYRTEIFDIESETARKERYLL